MHREISISRNLRTQMDVQLAMEQDMVMEIHTVVVETLAVGLVMDLEDSGEAQQLEEC